MCVQVRRADETRGRVHVAGQPAHARACAVGRQRSVSPVHGAGGARGHVHIAAKVLQVPRKARLIGQHVGGVAHHLQAFGGRLHYDAAACVGDDPVQHADGEVAETLVHQRDAGERRLDVVDVVEVRGDPQGELIRRDGRGSRAHIVGEVGVAGEVQAGDGQAVLVGAVEVQRIPLRCDGHAQHRAMPRVRGMVARRERDGFAVAVRPIQVAAEIQVSVRVGESNRRAHTCLRSISMRGFALALASSGRFASAGKEWYACEGRLQQGKP